MTRLSQEEVDKLLEEVEEVSVGNLNSFQKDAFNYLIDYLEMADNGIPTSREDERLFNLCIDIMKQILLDHGRIPK
jgi:hypothetical protein